MAYYTDLETCDYFDFLGTVDLVAVGWLEKEHGYSTGPVSREFYEKLSTLLVDPWSPVACAGPHECSLCQFEGAVGSKDLFVPHEGKIYVAPELILHYINCHFYCPPDEFVSGVMKCPDTRSMAYKKSLLANGGRSLVMRT